MLKKLFLFMLPLSTFAQITAIPDSKFEQSLIYLGIDSDGILNGQMLTSDAEAQTELHIGLGPLLTVNTFDSHDLTGLAAFKNVEYFTAVKLNLINGININGLTNLKFLNLNNTLLQSIDFSQNTLLEEIEIGNIPDMGSFSTISNIDLSNNPNVNMLFCNGLYTLSRINLNNGNNHNNPDMVIGLNIDVGNVFEPVCIQVDNINAAQNNLAPYNTWFIYGNYFYSDNCVLSVEKFVKENIKVYPNPTSDYVSITQSNQDLEVKSVLILDVTGKYLTTIDSNFENISLKNYASGTYLFVIHTNKGSVTNKIIVK